MTRFASSQNAQSWHLSGNICAYLENRQNNWSPICTWVACGPLPLSDTNSPAIWINVRNIAVRYGIGWPTTAGTDDCVVNLAHCAQTPTCLYLPFFYFDEVAGISSTYSEPLAAAQWQNRLSVFPPMLSDAGGRVIGGGYRAAGERGPDHRARHG